MPRTSRSISTPAWLAANSARMTGGSTSEFILARMRAGSPRRAAAASRSMRSMTESRMPNGATTRRLHLGGSAKPVNRLKSAETSSATSSRAVNRDRSVYSRAVCGL